MAEPNGIGRKSDEWLRHPILRCLCAEGRIVSGETVTWMPPVHDCVYIAARNVMLGRRAAAQKKGKSQ